MVDPLSQSAASLSDLSGVLSPNTLASKNLDSASSLQSPWFQRLMPQYRGLYFRHLEKGLLLEENPKIKISRKRPSRDDSSAPSDSVMKRQGFIGSDMLHVKSDDSSQEKKDDRKKSKFIPRIREIGSADVEKEKDILDVAADERGQSSVPSNDEAEKPSTDNFLPCAARPIRMKRPPLPPGIIGYKSGSIASNQIPLRFESKRPTFAKRIKITETETCKDASGLQPMEDVYRNSGKDSVLRDGQAVEKGEAATSVVESTSDAAGKQNQELVDQFDGIALKGHSLRSQFVGLGSSKGIVCKVHPDLQDRGTPAQYQCSGRTDNVSHFPEDREPRHHSRLHTLRNKQPLKILNEYAAKRSCQLAQVNLIHRESANPRLSPQKNVSIQSPILCLNHFKVQGSKCQHRHDAVLVTTMPSLFNNSDPPPEQLGGIEEFEFGLKPSGDRQVGKAKMANSQKLSCLNTFEACKSNFELQGKIHGAERQK